MSLDALIADVLAWGSDTERIAAAHSTADPAEPLGLSPAQREQSRRSQPWLSRDVWARATVLDGEFWETPPASVDWAGLTVVDGVDHGQYCHR